MIHSTESTRTEQTDTNPFAAAAQEYAKLGYRVFPCKPGGKTPLTKNGLNAATTDPGQIQRWWTQHPRANIGIATAGLIVVDVDTIDGQPNPWLSDDPEKSYQLAAARMSRTPRGGRHYVYRQPAGKAWRNTASKLAPKVDTRGIGGYIVVAPSVVEGKAYTWNPGQELSEPAGRLPEPPTWLIERLDRIAAPIASPPTGQPTGDTIPDGQRNATLASEAGKLRKVGMPPEAIEAALQVLNSTRCTPPLPPAEVSAIANSVGRYPVGDPEEERRKYRLRLVGDYLQEASRNGKTSSTIINEVLSDLDDIRRDGISSKPTPTGIADLIRDNPSLAEPVVDGWLRRGETANVIAASKMGKSWTVYGLAIDVATGGDWLGRYRCTPGRVLLIDNELHDATLAHRLPWVGQAKGYQQSDWAPYIDVLRLRGRLLDLHGIADVLQHVEPGQYDLVVLDAWYRSIPRDTSENDNAMVAQLYNLIDATTERLGAAWVNVHHSTKGAQSGKTIVDVGAGAGSQSRAADCHMVMRPHEEEGVVVLDGVVRSFPPPEPICLRWEFPLWYPDGSMDPAELKGRKTPAQERKQDEDKEATGKILAAMLSGPKTERELRGVIAAGKPRTERLLAILINGGSIQTQEGEYKGKTTTLYALAEEESV